MSISASRVGVVTPNAGPADVLTCTRCGITKSVNLRRRSKDGTVYTLDRRTYKCRDCLSV